MGWHFRRPKPQWKTGTARSKLHIHLLTQNRIWKACCSPPRLTRRDINSPSFRIPRKKKRPHGEISLCEDSVMVNETRLEREDRIEAVVIGKPQAPPLDSASPSRPHEYPPPCKLEFAHDPGTEVDKATETKSNTVSPDIASSPMQLDFPHDTDTADDMVAVGSEDDREDKAVQETESKDVASAIVSSPSQPALLSSPSNDSDQLLLPSPDKEKPISADPVSKTDSPPRMNEPTSPETVCQDIDPRSVRIPRKKSAKSITDAPTEGQNKLEERGYRFDKTDPAEKFELLRQRNDKDKDRRNKDRNDQPLNAERHDLVAFPCGATEKDEEERLGRQVLEARRAKNPVMIFCLVAGLCLNGFMSMAAGTAETTGFDDSAGVVTSSMAALKQGRIRFHFFNGRLCCLKYLEGDSKGRCAKFDWVEIRSLCRRLLSKVRLIRSALPNAQIHVINAGGNEVSDGLLYFLKHTDPKELVNVCMYLDGWHFSQLSRPYRSFSYNDQLYYCTREVAALCEWFERETNEEAGALWTPILSNNTLRFVSDKALSAEEMREMRAERARRGREKQRLLGLGFFDPEVQAAAAAKGLKTLRRKGRGLYDPDVRAKGQPLGNAKLRLLGLGVFNPDVRAKGQAKGQPLGLETQRREGRGLFDADVRSKGVTAQKRLKRGIAHDPDLNAKCRELLLKKGGPTLVGLARDRIGRLSKGETPSFACTKCKRLWFGDGIQFQHRANGIMLHRLEKSQGKGMPKKYSYCGPVVPTRSMSEAQYEEAIEGAKKFYEPYL